MSADKKSVLVLYNQIEKDEYEALRLIDPKTLDFTPSYTIHVATVQEEYDAIVHALRSVGFDAECINLQDNISLLHRLVTEKPPDAVFNLVEVFHSDLQREGAVLRLEARCQEVAPQHPGRGRRRLAEQRGERGRELHGVTVARGGAPPEAAGQPAQPPGAR